MKKAIMAKKIGMTQLFDQETGDMIPVTVLEAGPCVVTQVKTVEHDGYSAIQVGFGEIREKLVNKPLKGHFDKAGVEYKRHLEEFRIDGAEEYAVGSEIKADVFEVGDRVDVTGISKGKGYQGAIKRHGFSRGLSNIAATVLSHLDDEYKFPEYLESLGANTLQLLVDEFIDDIPDINAVNASYQDY